MVDRFETQGGSLRNSELIHLNALSKKVEKTHYDERGNEVPYPKCISFNLVLSTDILLAY